MTTKLEQAARQALDALNIAQDDCLHGEMAEESPIFAEAINALREALSDQIDESSAGGYGLVIGTNSLMLVDPNRSVVKTMTQDEYKQFRSQEANTINYDGTFQISCLPNDWNRVFAPIKQEHSCNQHPDAPHGFDRNASHNAGRYVCECEGWETEQAEQEPVAWVDLEQWQHGEYDCFTSEKVADYMTPLYSAPVRTKDLTDDEIFQFQKEIQYADVDPITFARAVIAADREKNK